MSQTKVRSGWNETGIFFAAAAIVTRFLKTSIKDEVKKKLDLGNGIGVGVDVGTVRKDVNLGSFGLA